MSGKASTTPSYIDCCPKKGQEIVFEPSPQFQGACTPVDCRKEEAPSKKPSRLKFEVVPVDDGQLWKCTKIVAPPKPIKWRCPDKKKPAKKKFEPTLGAPVGASFGSFTICSPNIKLYDELIVIQGYTTCLMAFGEIYITPEEEWDNGVLNRILIEGKEHVNISLEAAKEKLRLEQAEKAEKEAKENAKKVVDDKTKTTKKKETGAKAAKDAEKQEEFNLSELTEKHISKSFFICGNCMQIDLFEPFIIGIIASTDRKIPNFYYGIEKFMRKFKYCLVTVCKQYYLIWKNSGVFFIYDCYGRNEKLIKKPQTGYTALISLCTLENVNHFILNMSKLPGEEPFMIRRIKMIELLACSTVDRTLERRIRQREFEFINDHHAVLKGHLHLGTSCFKENRNKFALAVAMTTIIISKIDSPPTWDRYSVDKVLMTAHKFYTLWTNCRHTIELNLNHIPSIIEIGKFHCRITIAQIVSCGAWMCIPNYKQSEITAGIKKSFQKSSNLIVQVSNKTYALIKRGNMYYLLDPYSHDCRGGKTKVPFAHFHMFSTLNMLCCIFSNEIIELPFPSTFYIHTVTITYIKNKINPPEEIDSCKCAVIKERKDEVASLNDSLGDLTGKKELVCVAEKYGFVTDGGNLDSPGLSQTQIPQDYDDLKGSEDELDDMEDESEGLPEFETDESDDEKDKLNKMAKEKEQKEKDKKDKDKKEKSDKDKGDADKDKKDKDKKDKDKKDKDKKDKESKDKTSKDKSGKDKAEKEKKEKADKEKKEKAEKGKKDKGDKDKTGKDGTGTDKKGKSKGGGRKGKDGDKGSDEDFDSDEEEEEGEEEETEKKAIPDGCLPNKYPGYSCIPYNLAVAGSESGDYESLCNLLKTGLKCSDRILTMTPWGNYVVFKSKTAYLLYDGCTCNVNRFRHLDLTAGTAGLLCFWTLHDLLEYIIRAKGNKSKKMLNCEKEYLDKIIDQICEKYCSNSC